MADATATAKEALAKAKDAQKITAEDQARAAKGKPTPTQEENDLARLGATFETHEDDGSGPEPRFMVQRSLAADKPASYSTRSAAGSSGGSGSKPAA